jgi:predicted secreted protein
MNTVRARHPIAVSALCLVLATPLALADAQGPLANQLSLSASASAEVTNDVLVITFSTQREAHEASTVQTQLTQALNAALTEARKAAQPGQVDISTGSFSVQPRYAPKGETMKWQGTAELRAEGKDFDALTRLVGRIQTLSVAHVGYRLSREARDKVQAEVSAQAIARFRGQAETYAKAFGFSRCHAARGGGQHWRSLRPANAALSRCLCRDGGCGAAAACGSGQVQRHCYRQRFGADEVALPTAALTR